MCSYTTAFSIQVCYGAFSFINRADCTPKIYFPPHSKQVNKTSDEKSLVLLQTYYTSFLTSNVTMNFGIYLTKCSSYWLSEAISPLNFNVGNRWKTHLLLVLGYEWVGATSLLPICDCIDMSWGDLYLYYTKESGWLHRQTSLYWLRNPGSK